MSIELIGDRPFENRPSIEAKALRINLNDYIYGTFAEIGAGQEVARHFYRVGGASGTIAKTISAYDKSFSDNIYGEEDDGRYVTETRLIKMLDHEMSLLKTEYLEKKIQTNFFSLLQTLLLQLIMLKNTKVMDGWVLDFKLQLMKITVT